MRSGFSFMCGGLLFFLSQDKRGDGGGIKWPIKFMLTVRHYGNASLIGLHTVMLGNVYQY